MLKKNLFKQIEIILVDIELLVHQEHFLRKLTEKVDFAFVYDKVSSLYSEKDRPSIDPVVLIKMILIGYL